MNRSIAVFKNPCFCFFDKGRNIRKVRVKEGQKKHFRLLMVLIRDDRWDSCKTDNCGEAKGHYDSRSALTTQVRANQSLICSSKRVLYFLPLLTLCNGQVEHGCECLANRPFRRHIASSGSVTTYFLPANSH